MAYEESEVVPLIYTGKIGEDNQNQKHDLLLKSFAKTFYERPYHRPNIHYNPRYFLVLISMVVITSFILIFSYRYRLHNPIESDDDIFINDDDITLFTSNEYSILNYTLFPYSFLENSLLFEPYRITNLTLTSTHINFTCEYSWELEGQNRLVGVDSSGYFQFYDNDLIAEVYVEQTGEYQLNIYNRCNEESSLMITKRAWVKYVRRELSSLTEEDKNEFLDTLHTVWEINTSEGMNLYGERYKGLYYFATLHNDAGGNSVCDEFHTDSGFINNHVFLGSFLEQSMRLINPRVSLHYLEYTKYFSSDDFQRHWSNQMDGGNWTVFMTSEWFGANDPITGRIVDGRWLNTTVPYLNTDFFEQEQISQTHTFFPDEEGAWLTLSKAHPSSPYGLLRAPWNFNPSPYLTRYNNVNRLSTANIAHSTIAPYMGSTCDDYTLFIAQSSGSGLVDFIANAEGQIHGKVHFSIGGEGGDYCDKVNHILKSEYNFTNEGIALTSICAQTFFKFYTAIFIGGGTYNTQSIDVPPLNCTYNYYETAYDINVSPGDPNGPTCSCNPYYFQSDSHLNELLDLFYNQFVHFPAEFEVYNSIKNMSFPIKSQVFELLCSRFQFEGDMGGSSAAIDPIFWVAHGAVERLYQKVMFEDILSDKVYATSHSSYCSGHAWNGTKEWLKGFYFEDESVNVSSLTNAELLNIIDPTSDEYPLYIDYIYEDSTWSWCEDSDIWFKK